MKSDSLTHIDAKGVARIVDVSEKSITLRTACARAKVQLGAQILKSVTDGELKSAKGPVFQTAIIAGTMAAKRTGDLIPLCHPIGLDDCQINIEVLDLNSIQIECRVKVSGRTGVEMEALTGATVAALTVYDMCKAMSHDIEICNVYLCSKTGGRNNYERARD